jgi:ABC-2 type transport system ATP-binding protein
MSDNVIDVHGLTKYYPGVKAVDGIDFEVRSGEVFSLLGPNGAGKTTTVEILEGLRPPTGGTARVFGVDVSKDYTKIRKRVGVLPQEFEPFDRLTPTEAVVYWGQLFNRNVTKNDARALLGEVNLSERANVQGIKLSGGEKRKLGIAMALVGQPDLLFLDEPTTGLDPKARRDLWGLVHKIESEGRTVILTTHYLEEAEQLADNVAIMFKGKIAAQGPPQELVARNGALTTIVLGGAGAAGLAEVTRRGIPATLDHEDVLVRVRDPHEMKAILAKLSALELPIKDMYTRRGTLEDVFLSLIGAKMDEGVLQT